MSTPKEPASEITCKELDAAYRQAAQGSEEPIVLSGPPLSQPGLPIRSIPSRYRIIRQVHADSAASRKAHPAFEIKLDAAAVDAGVAPFLWRACCVRYHRGACTEFRTGVADTAWNALVEIENNHKGMPAKR